ncbi:hypothetical protein MUN82_21155 [Hymenobacter aerilatus]|uniref:SHOCT domain-containing protein n=1 Tax=Hymenobacter aerilatus TaxID=2932251 RepID=A0A8T9STF1_9BACT|nr:SHOCT domain-containing protein [Hymenobacter aerilatus]UOR05422.1 hypothetical protein MUN82_21155 [Hymenobacter aerilatus]
MEKDPSPLDTLRQLKEWLDAGAITPQEFEALKSKLVFNQGTHHEGLPLPGTPSVEPVEPAAESEYTPPPATQPPYVAPGAAAGPAVPLTTPVTPDVPSTSAGLDPLAPSVGPVPEAGESRSPLGIILIVGGIVLLLGLMAYLVFGGRESERLTSTSQTAADTVAVQPEVGPQAEQIELPPVVAPETVRVEPAQLPAAPAPVTDSTTTATVPTPTIADDKAVRTRVQQALTAYYADLQAPPFAAEDHFAPSVERFYTLQNTTPEAIGADLTASHFPEFTEEQTQVVPGSLKVEPAAEDGTRTATYLETSTSFRQSRQQHQQTKAQVRVRFDSDYKIVYLRQERLLENKFTE